MRTSGRAVHFTQLEVSERAALSPSQAGCVPPSKRCLKPFARGDQPRSQKLLRGDVLTRGETKPLRYKCEGERVPGEPPNRHEGGVFPSRPDPWDSPGACGFTSDSWVTTAARHPTRLRFPSRCRTRLTNMPPLPRLEPNITCGLFQPIGLFSEA